jgi:hypothetical protein
MDELDKALDKVKDAESFLVFARLLAHDRADAAAKDAIAPPAYYNPGANEWENLTIESFLEAAIRWAEATQFGTTQGLDPRNPWKQFAVFLVCGKIYE